MTRILAFALFAVSLACGAPAPELRAEPEPLEEPGQTVATTHPVEPTSEDAAEPAPDDPPEADAGAEPPEAEADAEEPESEPPDEPSEPDAGAESPPPPPGPMTIEVLQEDQRDCTDSLIASGEWQQGARCVLRYCEADTECADLDPAAVCSVDYGPDPTPMLPHCRLPKTEQGETCGFAEAGFTDSTIRTQSPFGDWQCETALFCRPISPSLLVCVPE